MVWLVQEAFYFLFTLFTAYVFSQRIAPMYHGKMSNDTKILIGWIVAAAVYIRFHLK